MKRIFTLLTFFISILSVCTLSVTEGYAQLTGDNYPVQAHVYVQRPSLKMPEYFSSTTMLRTDLILKDLTKTTLDVYLGWQITGLGLGVEAGTLPGFVPPNYLTLTKGSKRQLSGAELREYFQPGMLAVSGVGENVIFNGKLPEGFYTIKITAYEAGTGRQVSNTAETFFSVAYALPPVINLPLIGSEQPVTRPQSVLLQWMPRHTATGSNRITYSGKVCEVAEDEDPNVVINGSQNCFTIPAQSGTSYVLKASDLPLKVGKRYAFQVQVTDNNEQLEFQNQGYSEVSWFRFGEACKPPSGLQVNAIAAGRLNVSWNANLQATGYKLMYRSKNQTEWTEQTTLGTSVSLVSLNPELDYEFKVITVCEVGNESPESETVIWEGEGEVDEELEDLIKKVLNPLGEPIVSTGPGIQSAAVPGIEKAAPSDPLPVTFEDLIPKDPTKIPCISQLDSYENCSDNHPTITVNPTGDEPDLDVGDLVTIYDYIVVLTQISGGNPYSGKGLAQMPFLNNVKVPVEFSNVVIKQKDPAHKGGCVTEVNGYFRVRNGLTPEQIRQEEIDLIHKVRTNTDPGSIYISRGQVITELDEELTTTGKDLCDGKPVTDEAKQNLLKKHTLAKQGLQDWAEDVVDLYDELDLDDTEILSRIQALITVLEANIAIINSGEGCPENPDLKAEMDAITGKIKEDIEKSKEPADNLPKITDVVVKNITESEATITWKGDKRFTKYLVSYETVGQGVVVKEVTKPTLLLSQLDKNKIYNFTIKGITESSEHTFGPEEFSTLKSSFPPIENLTVLESDSLSYKISWDKDKEHKSYRVEYVQEDGSIISTYTENNNVSVNGLINGLIKVTAFDISKKFFSLANTSVYSIISPNPGGISQVITANELADQICQYEGSCTFSVGCTTYPTAWAPRGESTAVPLTAGVNPLNGNCLKPTYDSNLFKSCDIDMDYIKPIFPPQRTFICREKDEDTTGGTGSGTGISNDSPLKDIDKDDCITEDEILSLEGDIDLDKQPTYGTGLFCDFNYESCKNGAKKSSGCSAYDDEKEEYSLLKLRTCNTKKILKWAFCCTICKKKPKPATKKEVYTDSTYNEELPPDLDSRRYEITISVIPKKVTNNDDNCFANNGVNQIPKCYLEVLRDNSSSYESMGIFMYQIDKTYKSITAKMAPNGDMYYRDDDVEYWKISFKYTIAKMDNKWYSYDFNSGKWCVFTPFEPQLEVSSTKRCNEVDLVTLKTSGIAPFTYYVAGADGTTSEFTSDESSLELSELSAGNYTFSVKDANTCLSPSKTLEVKQTNSVDFNISKFYDCENTVYVNPVCGDGNYLYNYREDYWDTSNKITGLQNYLILNELKKHTFTIKVKDGTGKVISKQLEVKSHDYLVKLKSKGLPATITTVTSDEWNDINRGWFVRYEPLAYFSDKSMVVVKTNSSLCKSGSMSLEFPYAKLPVQLTIEADNGYSFSGTVNDRHYVIEDLSSGKYKISGTDDTGCELYTNNYENDEVEIITNSLKFEVSNLAYNCNASLNSIKLTTENSVVIGKINDYDRKYLTYDFFINNEKKGTSKGYSGSETIVNLSSGTYTARVEVNSEGCSITKEIIVPEVPPLTLTGQVYTDSGENAACGDDPTARVNLSLNVEGGLAPYSFSVSTATSSYSGNMSVFSNLENTNMTVSVIDKNKCTASFTYQPFDPMLVIPAAQNAACANGKINVTVTGGNQPYQYSLNNVDFQSSPDFENLDAGTYTVTVKDAFNCTASAEATVEREEYEISLSVTSENPTCGADGVINMEATGGRTPYQYSTNGGISWVNSTTESDYCPGTYGPFKVKDAGGCEAAVEIITLTAPEFIELVTPDDPPVMAMTDPQARAAADEDGVIVIRYNKRDYKVNVPHYERINNTSYDIKVNGKIYKPLFIKCSKSFAGYYQVDCPTSPCTVSKKEDFSSSDCLGNLPLAWNGNPLCKECWLEASLKELDILVFSNGYDPLKMTLQGFRSRKDIVRTADDINYWGNIGGQFIQRRKPQRVYYIDGNKDINTSNHNNVLSFTASMISSNNTYIERQKTEDGVWIPNRCFRNESCVKLNTNPNISGFDKRLKAGVTAGTDFVNKIKSDPSLEGTKIIIDIVAHSMGFAYAQGFINSLKESNLNINFEGYYVIAPENACSGYVESSEWKNIWQYGSNLGELNADPMWEQDGVAPQCGIRKINEGIPAKYGRIFIPKNVDFIKNFTNSHSISNYNWVFQLNESERGYVSQK